MPLLLPSAGAEPIGREAFEHVAKEYLLTEAVIETAVATHGQRGPAGADPR